MSTATPTDVPPATSAPPPATPGPVLSSPQSPLFSLFHVGPVNFRNLVALAHTIWTYLLQYADKNGIVDLTKIGILFHTLDLENIHQKLVQQGQALELIFLHSLLPALSEEDQKIVQEFVETILPALAHSFQSIMTMAKQKGTACWAKFLSCFSCCSTPGAH